MNAEGQEGDIKHEDSKATKGESHDSSGSVERERNEVMAAQFDTKSMSEKLLRQKIK